MGPKAAFCARRQSLYAYSPVSPVKADVKRAYYSTCSISASPYTNSGPAFMAWHTAEQVDERVRLKPSIVRKAAVRWIGCVTT
jgi:hypothetical protein